MKKRLGWLVVLSLVGMSVVACKKPKAGDACKLDGRKICTSKTEAVICVDVKYETMPCRGKDGCKTTGGEVECDIGVNVTAGEPCIAIEHNYECGADKKTLAKCDNKHWKIVDSCDGPKGCTSDEKEASCDSSIANVGSVCEDEDTHACTSDKKSLLVCKTSKWAVDSPCRGANGCRKEGDKMTCDTRMALAGDPCDGDEAACSTDGKSMLECQSKKMTVTKPCKKGCTVSGDDIKCN